MKLEDSYNNKFSFQKEEFFSEEKSLKKAIDFLKSKIFEANIKEVRIEDKKLLIIDKKRDISEYNINTLGELGRALVVIDLIKNKKIPVKSIDIEVEGPSFGSRHKSRIDLIINLGDIYNKTKSIAVGECKTSLKKLSDSEFRKFLKSQLFSIGRVLSRDDKLGYPLILFFYEVICDGNFLDLNFGWLNYPEIETSLETKKVKTEIIFNRQSPYIHYELPKVSGGKVYFISKALKRENLEDIKSASVFKQLLNEVIHQRLRKRGLVENDAFYFISNLLLAKVQDEIELESGKEEPDFQVRPEDYIQHEEFYNRINRLFRDAHIQLLKEDPKSANTLELLEHKNRADILLEVLPYLQRYRFRSLRKLNDDSLGDVFLDFMHEIFRQSRGIFFTHPNICRFVTDAVGIDKVRKELENGNILYVLDPSCGSGTFLIASLTKIFSGFEPVEIKNQAIKVLFGIDSNKDTVVLAKINMIMHGDGSANIHEQDALAPLTDLPFENTKFIHIDRFESGCVKEIIKEGRGFDFILTNPPFSLNLKEDAVRHFVMKSYVPWDKGSTNASECFFVERWFQLLNEGGRVGAVLPVAIFDSPEYYSALKLILCYFRIIAIIGLPEHAFQPFASQKTVLFFAIRRSLKEANYLYNLLNDEVNFIKAIEHEKLILYDVKNIGYRRVKRRKAVHTEIIQENDLTERLANLIKVAFDGDKNEWSEHAISIGELFSIRKKLLLSPTFTKDIHTLGDFTLNEEGWYIVENFNKNISSGKLICETGDIASMTGILLPKSFEWTTESNKTRIKTKFLRGKFVTLQEGDVIIAPVRVYQGKIAVVTKTASEKFLFSRDFIVLRNKQPDIIKSIELMLTLLFPENLKKVENLSTVGKSGYPKIKDKNALLTLKLIKIQTSFDKLKEYADIYENIYKVIFNIQK
ncbi:MAG: N-6 DNA methylase [Candidatus Omnitrophica bacterium]|nr:N-6 DNA methylase [Candidatus Omnitrophota bacterium]